MAFLKIKKIGNQKKKIPSFSSHQISKKKIDINVYIYITFFEIWLHKKIGKFIMKKPFSRWVHYF